MLALVCNPVRLASSMELKSPSLILSTLTTAWIGGCFTVVVIVISFQVWFSDTLPAARNTRITAARKSGRRLPGELFRKTGTVNRVSLVIRLRAGLPDLQRLH